MKVTATRKTIEGVTNWYYAVYDDDGNELSRRANYGRDLTGHTTESFSGIFSNDCDTFNYGAHKMARPADYPMFDSADTPAQRVQKIIKRVELVRAWVDGCKSQDAAMCGEASAEIPPTIDDLKKRIAALEEKRTVAREKSGRFARK